jgi:predicted DNA-binding transcriptional regulator YafY
MYHPTTRALAVLELLQTHRRLSGRDIAARLGVNQRTLRRYIVMLEELGVPIAAERGRDGAYMLIAGYKLPPMMFSADEALALMLGLVAARSLSLSDAATAVASAQAKLERVLPLPMQKRVRAVAETVVLDLIGASASVNNEILLALGAAANSQRRVCVRYRSSNGVETVRNFDTYGIALRSGAWYAVGYCHLRAALRSFRLDRVLDLQSLDSTFERPPDFDAITHLASSISQLPRSTPVEVVLHTDLRTARDHVHESLGVLTECENGIALIGHEDDLDWYARQLARMPFGFHVRAPRALRDALAVVAARVASSSRAEVPT